jgi:hypothetical protein
LPLTPFSPHRRATCDTCDSSTQPSPAWTIEWTIAFPELSSLSHTTRGACLSANSSKLSRWRPSDDARLAMSWRTCSTPHPRQARSCARWCTHARVARVASGTAQRARERRAHDGRVVVERLDCGTRSGDDRRGGEMGFGGGGCRCRSGWVRRTGQHARCRVIVRR